MYIVLFLMCNVMTIVYSTDFNCFGSGSGSDIMCDVIKNNALQCFELQGNRGGTDKSHQNSRGTVIAELAGAAPFM